jgi:hypothetical protein
MSGKKKGKIKFRNAEEAQRARQLDTDWKDLLKRQGVESEEKKRKRAMAAAPLVYDIGMPSDRSTSHIKSLGQTTGIASLKHVQMYTGTKVLGIATLHKSNAVPVFSSEEAVDISKMRR